MLFHNRLKNINQTAYIKLNTSLCRACWDCIGACKQDALGKIDLPFHKHALVTRPGRCNGCKICVRTCRHHAIDYIQQ